MASSISSPALPLPGKFDTRHLPHSSAEPPPSAHIPLPRSHFLLPISGPSSTAPRRLLPIVRSGWREPSALSHTLLDEFLGEYVAEGGKGSRLSPTAAESVAAAYPALANTHVLRFKSGYYNFQVTVGEDEPDEVLFRRFRKEAMKSGVIQECRRRQFFEDKQAKKKRKAREAARKNRRRPLATGGSSSSPFISPHQRNRSQGAGAKKSGEPSNRRYRARTPLLDIKEASKKDEDEEEDIWELPEVEIPY